MARYEFKRDAGGRVSAMHLTSRGAELDGTRAEGPLPSRATTPEAPAYAGRYRLSPTMVFDVQAVDGQLHVKLADQPRYVVYPTLGWPDRFSYDVVQAALQFERDESGKVAGLVLHQNGQHRAPKTE